jgi:hypothetical protein
MFVLKRVFAVMQSVALGCAALLMIVLSVSSRQGADGGRGLAVQALYQAIGFRTPNFRRAVNHAPLRVSTIRKVTAEDAPASSGEYSSSELACIETHLTFCAATLRFLAKPPTPVDGVFTVRVGIDVPQPRAPPAENA